MIAARLKGISKHQAYLRLARPRFLVPGLVLYLLGFLMALSYGAEMDLGRLLWGYLIFFLAHAALPFSNDYFDQVVDANNSPTALSGGSGMLHEHPEMAGAALRISLVLMVGSIITALLFQFHYRPEWYLIPLVLFGNLTGFFYAAPPFRLSYRGLGEVSTMLAAGVAMPAMGYICAAGGLGPGFLLLVPAFLAYGAFFIFSVEMPDVEGDRQGGKRHLLVRYGLPWGIKAAFLSALLGTLWFGLLALVRPDDVIEHWPMAMFSLVPLAAAWRGAFYGGMDRNSAADRAKLNILSLMTMLSLIAAQLYLFLR